MPETQTIRWVTEDKICAAVVGVKSNLAVTYRYGDKFKGKYVVLDILKNYGGG